MALKKDFVQKIFKKYPEIAERIRENEYRNHHEIISVVMQRKKKQMVNCIFVGEDEQEWRVNKSKEVRKFLRAKKQKPKQHLFVVEQKKDLVKTVFQKLQAC